MPLEKSKDSMSITLTTSTGQDPTVQSSGSFNCIQQQKLLPETGSKNSAPAQTREGAHNFQLLIQMGSVRVCMSKGLGASLTGRKQLSTHTPGRGLSILPCAEGLPQALPAPRSLLCKEGCAASLRAVRLHPCPKLLSPAP